MSSVAQSWTEASRGDRISPIAVLSQLSGKGNNIFRAQTFTQTYPMSVNVFRISEHWKMAVLPMSALADCDKLSVLPAR
jgi:hypothetical protein